MTAQVFLDTSYLLALVRKRDNFHVKAVEASALVKGPFLTTDLVLIEFANSLAAPPVRAIAVEIIERIRAVCFCIDGYAWSGEQRMRNTNKTDPVIAEIHAIREAHVAEFNYDLKAMFDDVRLRDFHKNRRVVSLRGNNGQTVPRAMEPEEKYN